MTTRIVRDEILDGLPPDDPRARHSRADLRRINALMLNDRVVAGLLRSFRPCRILEIGAGDGASMLRVARRLPSPLVKGASVTLLDRQPFTPPEGFASLGWGVEVVTDDAFDFLANSHTGAFDAIVANLFLHHFEEDRLSEILWLIAERTDLFVACEPRRSAFALMGTRMLALIGCNDVTRHDARVSVRAGFRDGEIAARWPTSGWRVEERAAPPFGHAFRAVRTP